MKRWHEESAKAKKQCKAYKDNFREAPGFECVWVDQVGRYRKTKGLDCGNPRCFICHSDKFPKRSLTKYEIQADISYREMLDE
jgi:hypothetical protein